LYQNEIDHMQKADFPTHHHPFPVPPSKTIYVELVPIPTSS
jgi:hypothetical protein